MDRTDAEDLKGESVASVGAQRGAMQGPGGLQQLLCAQPPGAGLVL